jgi:hypothetical protein
MFPLSHDSPKKGIPKQKRTAPLFLLAWVFVIEWKTHIVVHYERLWWSRECGSRKRNLKNSVASFVVWLPETQPQFPRSEYICVTHVVYSLSTI